MNLGNYTIPSNCVTMCILVEPCPGLIMHGQANYLPLLGNEAKETNNREIQYCSCAHRPIHVRLH